MYIELLYDTLGNITACYCVDTLPYKKDAPLFELKGGMPQGAQQARINLDTLTAMEIDAASGQKAVIDPVTGKPALVTVDRAEYIMKTFKVDVNATVTTPPGVVMPAGMKVKTFARR
ncbi:hypothetical protein EPN18_09990 [bacterium]|nr:MAG: hypothetical protein EPN18_09990 [bacterium]